MKKKWKDLTKEERNEYVNQDHVILKELPLDVEEWYGCTDVFTNYIDTLPPEELELVVIDLHLCGMKTGEIAYHVPYCKRWIRRIIYKYKNKNRA